jgi:hypothetical protein
MIICKVTGMPCGCVRQMCDRETYEEWKAEQVKNESEQIEACSRAAHEAWMAEKASRGVKTWPNEHGVEQMVHWDQLAEDVREFDRVVVRAVLKAMRDKGLLP